MAWIVRDIKKLLLIFLSVVVVLQQEMHAS